MRTYISIAIFASMTFLGANSVEAQNNGRGPMGFSSFDTNSDNIMTEKEFNDARAERMKNSNGQGQGKGMNISFADIDTDGNGEVTIKEFDNFHAKMMKKHRGNRNGKGHRNMQNPKAMFAKMDSNSDKFISEDELIAFRQLRMKKQAEKGGKMKGVGNAPTFESIDTNGDGNIDKSEFENHMKNDCRRNK